ncbi:hypothetical protein DRN73_04510 [Candidatus Pacearchaeota archaeon]|nr:MAG: hypothetical protein DRN73_04510 [Candidatus Pacearchaeota archaeon]
MRKYSPKKIPEDIEKRRRFLGEYVGKMVIIPIEDEYIMGILHYSNPIFYLKTSKKNRVLNLKNLDEILIQE